MKKLFIGSLPATTTEASLEALLAQYGKVHSLKLAKDLFSGQCKGFGFFALEGHEARAVIAALNSTQYEGKTLKVNFEVARSKARRR